MKFLKSFEQFNINESSSIDGKYVITYGLGGGFNTSQSEVIEASSEAEASKYAYEKACEEYENYVGMHGLRTTEEIIEEDGVDEEEAEEIYSDERESWLNYHAEPYDEEKHGNATNESTTLKIENMYGYPTLEEVEEADHEQICRWYRHLPSPGSKIPDSLPNDEFKSIIDKQAEVMNLICSKFKSGGGFNPDLSKKIGW